jgi:hypothetical protein
MLARAVVDDGWTITCAAAMSDLARPGAERWAERSRTGGTAAMEDRSTGPRTRPRRKPPSVVHEIGTCGWTTCRGR